MIIKEFQITNKHLSFKLDGIHYSFNLSEISTKLARATEEERETYKFSSSGYGIHWEMLNEDLSFKGLIRLKN